MDTFIKELIHIKSLSELMVLIGPAIPFFMMVDGKPKPNKVRIAEIAFLALILGGMNYFQTKDLKEELKGTNTRVEKVATEISDMNDTISLIRSDIRNTDTRLTFVENAIKEVTQIKPKIK